MEGLIKTIAIRENDIFRCTLIIDGENVSTRRLKQKRKEDKINRILQGYQSDAYPDDVAFVRSLARLQANFVLVEDAD